MISVRANRTNKHSRARVRARIERAAAASRDVKCGNSSRKGDEKPLQDAATVIISYFNFIDEFFV